MAGKEEKLARMQEIANRGLQDRLPPEKKAIFDEAARRGLIQIVQPQGVVQQPTAPQPAQQMPEPSPYEAFLQQAQGRGIPSDIPPEMGFDQEKMLRTLGNVPQSANKVGLGLMELVRNAPQVANLVGSIPLAAVENLIPGEQIHERPVAGLYKGLLDEAKKWKDPGKRFEESPVEALLDLSIVGKSIDPFVVAGKVAGKVGEAGRVGGTGLRALLEKTTGVGAESYKELLKAGEAGGKKAQEFSAVRKGLTKPEDVAGGAEAAFRKMGEKRGAEYKARLKEVSKISQPINPSDLSQKIGAMLQEEKIAFNPLKPNDKAAFAQSTMSNVRDQRKLSKVLNDVNTWKDWTPSGVDTLKQRIGNEINFGVDATKGDQMLRKIYSDVRDSIVAQVPEYRTMTREYELATSAMNDIQNSLKVGKKAAVDTTLARMNSAMKEGGTYKLELLDELESFSGGDLKVQLAALATQEIMPIGGFGRVAATTALASAAISPKFIGLLATGSPRLVGNLFYSLGVAKGTTNKAINAAKKLYVPGALGVGSELAQAGAAQEATQ